MQIKKISIKNIYAFDDVHLDFQSLNAIVGPNNSGKTNLIRLLALFEKHKTIQHLQLSRKIKLNENSPSQIILTLQLSEKESKILYSTFWQQDLQPSQISDDIKEITIGILWDDTVNESSHPSNVIIRLNNGITMQGNDLISLYYTESIDDALSNLDIPIYANNNNDTQTQFVDEHHTNPGVFENSEDFSTAFMNNSIPAELITTLRTLSLRRTTNISYDRSNPKQFIFDIFDFVDLDKENNSQTDFLDVLGKIFSNSLTLVSEIRPHPQELAKLIYNFRDNNEDEYQKLKKRFNLIYDSTFILKKTDDGRVIQILISENGKEFPLENSSSGYYAAIYLLYMIQNKENNVIFLDEPESHFHPTKLYQLGEVLSDLTIEGTNQIFMITHSPMFLNYSMLSNKNVSIAYFRKKDFSTMAKTSSEEFIPQMKSYYFDSQVFFENIALLVEGPSDEYVMKAISEAYDGIFRKHNVALVNTGGKDQLEFFIKLLIEYNIPYVGMADSDYEGISENVIILEQDLEDEVEKLGWNRRPNEKLKPEKGFEFMMKLHSENKSKIEKSIFWQIIEKVKA